MTLADAQAQCRALGVDLRRSGRNMNQCMDLLAPFCPDGVEADITEELPRCGGAAPSPAKAAALLKEAEARAGKSGPPWLLIGAGVVALGVVVFVATR